MSETTREFCVACGDDREIRREKQTVEYDVRGEKIVLELPVRVCQTCDTVECEGVDPAEMAFAEYRRRKGLLTPEQIRGIRKQYKLSQKSLAALLGMSEATINRYEGGSCSVGATDFRICNAGVSKRFWKARQGNCGNAC
jgi:putative zinc finger/helix-turn-helix YgiT family protein